MKHLLIILLFFPLVKMNAQKKLVPANSSALTGIALPADSKSDKRLLMVMAAKALLELESKKAGTGVKDPEVFLLPPQNTSGFSSDSLVDALTKNGWLIYPLESDTKFAWLQKANTVLLLYFSTNPKQTDLYFSETVATPVLTGVAINTPDPAVTTNPQVLRNTNINPANQSVIQNPNNIQQPDSQVKKEENPVEIKNTPIPEPVKAPGTYTFNTTNFDDGWTSVIKEDWVEVSKGNIKVLLHYPKEGTVFPADPDPLIRAAWDILVAPRYSSLNNFKTISPSLDYERAYLGWGTTTTTTGNTAYVALFRKAGGWMEFICPDKASFVKEFRVDPDIITWDANSDIWDHMKKMSGYNRFAVAASDFSGKWSDHFASNTYYANIYTGTSAGMSTYTSSQWFQFGAGQSYQWELVAANSYGGSTKFASAKGAGNFKVVNNWQLWFSDIEGKPKTFNAYFSATKGGRVLWMNDANYPGSGIYTGYSRE